jgi:hypothetical protein
MKIDDTEDLNKAAAPLPNVLKNAVAEANSLLGKISSPAAGETGINEEARRHLESKLSRISQIVSLLQV